MAKRAQLGQKALVEGERDLWSPAMTLVHRADHVSVRDERRGERKRLLRAVEHAFQPDYVRAQVVRHKVHDGEKVRSPSITVLRSQRIEDLLGPFGFDRLASIEVMRAPEELGED